MKLSRLKQFDVLVLTSLIWFLSKYLRYVLPPLFEPLKSTYGVSNAALGMTVTGFLLVYAVMQFPSGLLADSLGSVRVIIGGTLLTAICSLALVVNSPFVVLVGMMILMGAGTGTHKTVAVELLSRTYTKRTGLALGVLDTFGTFGGAAAPATVVLFTGLPPVFGDSWRTIFLCSGFVGIGLAIAFTSRAPKRIAATYSIEPEQSDSSNIEPSQYAALFQRWQFTIFVLITVLFSFAYSGATAFLPLYLTEEANVSINTANLLYSILFLVSPVQLFTGEASDRVGTLVIISLTLGLATVAIVMLSVISGSGGLLALGATIVCLGIGAHGYRPVRGVYVMSIVPESIAGGSLGVVRTLLMIAGAFGPAVIGYLSEVVGFRVAFWVLSSTLITAIGLLFMLWIGRN